MIRRILAVIAGLFAANLVVFGVEWIGMQIYPVPDVVDAEVFRLLPVGAFMVILTGWLLGTAVGVLVAQKISVSGTLTPGWIVGGFLLAATAWNLKMIPHPLWVVVLALVGIPLVTWWVARATVKPRVSPVPS